MHTTLQTALQFDTVELIRLNNGLNLKIDPILEEKSLSVGNLPITVEYKPLLPNNLFEGNYYSSVFTTEPTQLDSSYFSLLVQDKPSNTTPQQNIINSLMNLTFCLTSVNNIEMDLIKYYKSFDKVKQIFISKNEGIRDIRILLDLNEYNIDYMEEFFSKAQFPIQDKYSDQEVMLNFEYIFSYDDIEQDKYSYLGECIYTSLTNV